jgi:hypothetical protein
MQAETARRARMVAMLAMLEPVATLAGSRRLLAAAARVQTQASSCGICNGQDAFGRVYKKFWGELIAYLPLIQHGPHRKRHAKLFHCCVCIR